MTKAPKQTYKKTNSKSLPINNYFKYKWIEVPNQNT